MTLTAPPCPATARLCQLPLPVLHQVVAHALNACVAANDALPTKGAITRFHSKSPPALEIGAYLSRLCLYTPFPKDATILALLALDRISRIATHIAGVVPTALFPSIHRPTTHLPPSPTVTPSPSFAAESPPSDTPSSPASESPTARKRPTTPPPILNSFTLHRLVASTLLVTSKFTSDGFILQSRAAKVAGVERAELVRLEVEVLKALEWTLWFEMDDLEGVSACLLRLGEEMGIVERLSPTEPRSEGADEDTEEEEGTESASSSTRTSSESSRPPPLITNTSSSSIFETQSSSTTSTAPSSPPTPAAVSTKEPELRRVTSRASDETVNSGVEKLSFCVEEALKAQEGDSSVIVTA